MFIGVVGERPRESFSGAYAAGRPNARCGISIAFDSDEATRKTLRPMSMGRLLFFLALLIFAGAAHAETAPSVALRAGADAPSLAPYIRYGTGLADPGGMDAATLLERAGERINGPTIHFGPPGGKTTVVLKVRNEGPAQGSWIFTTGRGSLKYIRIYEAAGGALSPIVDGNDPAAVSENLLTYQAFSSELVLDPGQEKLLVVDFLSENSTYMPLKIQTYGTFFKQRRANIAMVSAVVVGAIVLIFLNMLFFGASGHREFAWLAAAQLFFALNTIHSEGYFTIFLLANQPLAGVAVEDFIKCGFAAAMMQFGRSFLATRRHFPRRDLALRLLIGAAAAIMILQFGLAFYPPAIRMALHIATWLVTVGAALFLPFIGYAAMRIHGRQLWPLFAGWGSLALFIIYAAIASMGVFEWLPINWHLAGPVGLFEAVMVTLALGMNLRKIQRDKLAADQNYARSLKERVLISEEAARLAEDKADALATIHSQNALLHASGHDSQQVILALNSAIEVLGQGNAEDRHADLRAMLKSSAAYLEQIVSTTMSGAAIGGDSRFVALGAFRGSALAEPLVMMFKAPFAEKGLTLSYDMEGDFHLVTDRPLLMRALANLLSNSFEYSVAGGTRLTIGREAEWAVVRIVDTGVGMTAETLAALSRPADGRLYPGEGARGSGSGFRAARRLVEGLGGTVEILSSTRSGTDICVKVPQAFAIVEPCDIGDLRAALPDWEFLDFDHREMFDQALADSPNPRRWIAAATFDESTVTRGRLGDAVGLMLVKPLVREMTSHPLLAGSEQP